MRIHFLGDIMLARNVKDNLNSSILNGISEISEKGDFFIGNLECSISDIKLAVPEDFQAPSAMSGYLTNITGVSLANNHIFDGGLEIAFDTIKNLDKVGIQHTGMGRNKKEAFKPIYLRTSGNRIAVFSITTKEIFSKNAMDFDDYLALIEDYQLLRMAINEAKSISDKIILLPHMGTEYVDFPSKKTILQYRQLIEIGADIVIGTHPHVIQGSEVCGKGLIFYSLGDFVFDSLYQKRKETIAVSIGFDGENIIYSISHLIKNKYCLPEINETHFENLRKWCKLKISLTNTYSYKYLIRYLLCKIDYQAYQFKNTIKGKGLKAGFDLFIKKIGLMFKSITL